MEEGTIIEWLVAVGDEFSEGQELCEIESEKVVNVLEAPFSGTLRKIIAVAEDALPVKAPIGICAPAEVSDEDIEAFALSIQNLPQASEPASVTEGQAKKTEYATVEAPLRKRPDSLQTIVDSGAVDIPLSLQGGTDGDISATPRALALAESHGINLSLIGGTGRNNRISISDIRSAIDSAGGYLPRQTRFVSESVRTTTSLMDDSVVSATPLARRVAASMGVNLGDCIPTGRYGRVLRRDVEVAGKLIFGAPDTNSDSAALTAEPLPKTDLEYQDASLPGTRKTIAARLAGSKQSAPHFRLTLDCEIDALLGLRTQINEENPAAQVSVNDFIVKAVAMSLLEVPECNIQFNGETVRTFQDAHVSVAVARDSGLITPVIQTANKKGLIEISNESRALATKAKANKLKPAEIQGGTFTVSNLGMYGIRQFDAIINPPQAAILAVGTGTQRPHVVDGELKIASLVTVTLSSDHRVIDGALGAKWLSVFKEFVERPARLLS